MCARQLRLSLGSQRNVPDARYGQLGGRPFLEVWEEIPADVPDQSVVKVNRSLGRSVHNIGFYPSRFIDQIPRWAIHRYSNPLGYVLDPFAGVGTTIVEALLAKRTAIGIDYHPLAVLISSIKVDPPSANDFRRSLELVSRSIRRVGDLTHKYAFEAREFWFQPEVVLGLCAIRHALEELKPSPSRRLLQVAFATSVRKLSNMDDGMILAAKRSQRNGVKHRTKEEVFATFVNYALDYGHRVSEYVREVGAVWEPNKIPGEAIGADARRLEMSNTIDLIVGSPPYINSMDYIWATKLELHWLGMVTSPQDRLKLYEKEIGTEHIKAAEYQELGETGVPEIDTYIGDIYHAKNYMASGRQNQLRARCTYRYFLDMEQHLRAAYHTLREGGHYVLVAGNNRICKVDVPTAELLTILATKVGFTKIHEFAVILRNRTLNVPRNIHWASTIEHDRVITLKK